MKEAPVVLALETSTEVCSAALAAGGRIEESTLTVPREHTRHILGQVDELLGEAGVTAGDLAAVAFGRGPGTFTGVRIATALAQGLAVARGLPLLPVSSLAALAWKAWHEHQISPVLAVMDARLEEVYWAMFEVDAGEVSVLHPESLSAPAELLAQLSSLPGGWQGAGSGWALPEMQPGSGSGAAVDSGLRPDARSVLELALQDFRAGRVADFEQAQPTYLRHPVRS